MSDIKVDHRGVPRSHRAADDQAIMFNGEPHEGPALVRHEHMDYTGLPMMPKAVLSAKKRADDAAELVRELDTAAYSVLDAYRVAPRKAAARRLAAVEKGEAPESTEVLDAELDTLARQYRDTVAHRRAVESHLVKLVDAYHEAAEKAFPTWRDSISEELEKRAEPARVTLVKSLAEARAVYGLASAVNAMDNPSYSHQGERKRGQSTAGKELPEVFIHQGPPGDRAVGGSDSPTFGKDIDAANRIATMWLKVDGRFRLGIGAIPESLTIPVADLSSENPDAKKWAEEKAENERRIREFMGARSLYGLA